MISKSVQDVIHIYADQIKTDLKMYLLRLNQI